MDRSQRVYTIDLGWKLLSIARSIGCLDDVAMERLDDMRASLETHRRGGLTEKNMTLVRQVISGDVWRRVINLPEALMAQARLLSEQSPVKAAVTAQLAVAIAILTNAPVRLSNLVQIRLDKNLNKPGGPDAPYMLVFPDYDVKNRVNLEFPFDPELTGLIEEYVHHFRPSLLRGSNELWLFPGETGGCKDAKTLSDQITERVEKATGLFITVHQFRHAAAAIWLQYKPGDYETVRRILGHKRLQTTINFYCGLETLQANRDFGDLATGPVAAGKSAMTSCSQPQTPPHVGTVRSVPFAEWPEADRFAATTARRPAERLKRGGAAAHMKDITFRDLARRYGYFLDYVRRTEGLDLTASAASYVTPARVDGFLAELQARVRSVTVHGSIYKLRRMAQVLDPTRDFSWLVEIENDLAAAMQPQPKFGRFVYSHVLIKVGTDLMTKAEAAMHRSTLARARQFRNGLMVAMLGYHPLRPKNFAALELGLTFRLEFGSWWIVLPRSQTKEKRADERIVDSRLIPWIDRYLEVHRPVLARRLEASNALWLSSNNGRPLTHWGVEQVISRTTLATTGIRVSPHLFRTAAVSTAAVYAGNNPHLGSALLHHRDASMREKHYNRASSLSATQSYGALVRALRKGSANQCPPERP